MVIIFDLDDTLYDERTFVLSGFEQVAIWIASQTYFSKEEILKSMKDDLVKHGRGAIFDNVLKRYYKKNNANIRKCISIYRLHKPNIMLDERVSKLLHKLRQEFPLYIVTDGNKLVQANKVQALRVDKYVKKVFLTHRYGINASKPSLICFEKIKKLENTSWDKIMYIGDNPKKDFVNLNNVNAVTVRILNGEYANLTVESNFDAKYFIYELDDLNSIIENENR